VERPALASLEFVVDDLDKALELLVDLMGLELLSREPHATLAADVALLAAGPIAISVIQETETVERMPLSSPEPRLAQMVFTIGSETELLNLRDHFIDAGASVVSDSPTMFHLSESMIEGVFGASPVPVFLVPPEQSPGRAEAN
jgi:catechol 2,3-dioxygenase-like lactoylglutathione lyase family enzyme